MKQIKDETELPPAEPPAAFPDRVTQARYIRSLCDPRVLIEGRTGDVFTRADGAMWEWPAYQVDRDDRGRVTREHRPAWGDSHRYPPGSVAP